MGGAETTQTRRYDLRREAVREQIERETDGKTGASKAYAAINAYAQEAPEAPRRRSWLRPRKTTPNGDGGGLHSWISPHPSLQSRLKRLQAQGAHVDAAAFAEAGPTPKQMALIVLVGGPLIALCAVLLEHRRGAGDGPHHRVHDDPAGDRVRHLRVVILTASA